MWELDLVIVGTSVSSLVPVIVFLAGRYILPLPKKISNPEFVFGHCVCTWTHVFFFLRREYLSLIPYVHPCYPTVLVKTNVRAVFATKVPIRKSEHGKRSGPLVRD